MNTNPKRKIKKLDLAIHAILNQPRNSGPMHRNVILLESLRIINVGLVGVGIIAGSVG